MSEFAMTSVHSFASRGMKSDIQKTNEYMDIKNQAVALKSKFRKKSDSTNLGNQSDFYKTSC